MRDLLFHCYYQSHWSTCTSLRVRVLICVSMCVCVRSCVPSWLVFFTIFSWRRSAGCAWKEFSCMWCWWRCSRLNVHVFAATTPPPTVTLSSVTSSRWSVYLTLAVSWLYGGQRFLVYRIQQWLAVVNPFNASCSKLLLFEWFSAILI